MINKVQVIKRFDNYGFSKDNMDGLRAFTEDINFVIGSAVQPVNTPAFKAFLEYFAIILTNNKEVLVELGIPRPPAILLKMLPRQICAELESATFYGEESKEVVKSENSGYRHWFKQIRDWILNN